MENVNAQNSGRTSSGPELAKQTEALKPTSRWHEILSFAKTLLIIIAAAIFLRATVIEAFKIPSGSMVPTLRIGDRIFVWKLAYGLRFPFIQKTVFQYRLPQRGDVVVFTRENDSTTIEDESSTNIIKRVVGLPGDTVEVKGSRVYINNQPYEEAYARWEDGGIREGNFGPETVPPDRIFLLGDNRDRSKDSRFWGDSPYLPVENVKGKAFLVYWSWDSVSRIGSVIR